MAMNFGLNRGTNVPTRDKQGNARLVGSKMVGALNAWEILAKLTRMHLLRSVQPIYSLSKYTYCCLPRRERPLPLTKESEVRMTRLDTCICAVATHNLLLINYSCFIGDAANWFGRMIYPQTEVYHVTGKDKFRSCWRSRWVPWMQNLCVLLIHFVITEVASKFSTTRGCSCSIKQTVNSQLKARHIGANKSARNKLLLVNDLLVFLALLT